MRPTIAKAALSALLLLTALLPLLAPAPVRAKEPETIFTLTDPRGDDNGDGTLTYPLKYYGLSPGDLDLLSLTARRVDDGTEFEATFANPIRPTARRTIDEGGTTLDSIARFGFYTTNLDIYIDTDRVPGSGATHTLPGRKAEVDPKFAWEKMICLTPRPFDARTSLKRILLKELQKELRDKEGRVSKEAADQIKTTLPADVDTHIFFPSRIRVFGRSLRFFVPDSFLGGPAKTTWAYTVIVTGADVDQRFDLSDELKVTKKSQENLMVLPIGIGGADDRFGGAQEDDDLEPPILDMLVPPGFTQQRILRDYNLRDHKPVQLLGVVPAEVTGKEAEEKKK
jgi:C-terminal binding-module, SLH-like, of glucodextranase